MTSTNTYDVQGMTCEHCVSAVSAELAKLGGVQDVVADLDTGKVIVTSDTDLEVDAVKAAVDEAGYELVR
jgi:copper ion binding protein